MTVEELKTLSIIMWTVMLIFLVLTIFLFFALRITKAWKIIMGTNFNITLGRRGRESGELGRGIGSQRLYSRNIGSRKLSSKKLRVSGNISSENLQGQQMIPVPRPTVANDETLPLSLEQATMILGNDQEEETMLLSSPDFEMVVDIMFIHTEVII